MTERYVLRGETWVSKTTGKPMETRDGLFVPMIRSDLPSYISPITKQPVEGRAARREDMARSGSREVDPSEYKPVYHNKKYAESAGGEWQPREKPSLGEGYVRRKAS
ncbi:MAG: hypothetical protein Q8R02_23520 [Hyphomonadaceae bacterium]|nr:hypothetical protein [Hyphomonadaceae bacterium]